MQSMVINLQSATKHSRFQSATKHSRFLWVMGVQTQLLTIFPLYFSSC